MDTITDAYAHRLESELAQFEANAGLWRLEIDRHAFRLRENQAVGIRADSDVDAAKIALEGVVFEIDRLQAFAHSHAGMTAPMVLRLAEAGLALESARRRLHRALSDS